MYINSNEMSAELSGDLIPPHEVPELYSADVAAGETESPGDLYTLALFRALQEGSVDPHEAGLTIPAPSLGEGLAAVTYVQPRVTEFGEDGVVEADIVKFQSLDKLTPLGLAFTGRVALLDTSISTKELGGWRVSSPLHDALRKTSADELPQLAVNVMGLARDKFPNAMDMNLVGAARPVIASEIEYKGDNANPHYAKALRTAAETHNLDTDVMHKTLGNIYTPGLITPATAAGHRRIGSEAGMTNWINGILRYDAIQQQAPLARAYTMGRLMTATALHVARRSDAA